MPSTTAAQAPEIRRPPPLLVMDSDFEQSGRPSLVRIGGESAVSLEHIKLPSTVTGPDAEGNCVLTLQVPAKFRCRNNVYIPLSVSPAGGASLSLPTSLGGDTSTPTETIEVVQISGSDGASPSENIIRILPPGNGISPLDLPGFQPFPYMPAAVQASPVSVLTEPLAHTGGGLHSNTFPGMFGNSSDASKDVVGVETPVLRCTRQPLFIPNSRQSSTTAWQSTSSAVNSTATLSGISVLSTPTLSSLVAPYQGVDSPCSPNSRPSPRPHVCHVCNESQTSAMALVNHLDIVHNEKPKNVFTCEKCGATFFRRYRYHEHVHAYHTGDGDRQFVCTAPGCGKKYRYRRHLRRHTRCHGDVSEFRRFECDICGKRFPRVSQRDEHRNIHTGEKPFVCDICSTAYSHSSTLWLHRKRHETGKIDEAGNPIPGSSKDDDGINVLNASSDASWQDGPLDESLADLEADDASLDDAATDAARLAVPASMADSVDGAEGSQSVIVHSDAFENSAHVLVSIPGCD